MATHRIETQLRIDEKTHEKVKQIAKLENRSRNYIMEHFIKQGADSYFKRKRKKPIEQLYDD